MALLRTSHVRPDSFAVAVASGNTVRVGTRPLHSSNEASGSLSANNVALHALSFDVPSAIRIVEFSPSGSYLVAYCEEKRLKLWTAPHWTATMEREVPRRATAVHFTQNEDSLLVSDKAGEVLRYTLPRLEETDGLMLGHSSMLLDVRHCTRNGQEFVITCDRDEKIRVSHFPNGYNIHTFCLGHTELVSRLCLCSQFPWLLLSASGDGTLRVWDWYEGKLLHTETCSEAVEDGEASTVFELACSRSGEDPVVVAAIDKLPELKVCSLLESGCLVEDDDVALRLPAVPWSCVFDHLDRLWVCLPVELEPVLCFRHHRGKFSRVSCDEESLLAHLCKWDYFKDSVGTGTVWSELKKHDFDNMSMYLARKQERLLQRGPAGVQPDHKRLSSDPASLITEDAGQPAKLPKLD